MIIRPNPLAPITWLTTAGAADMTPHDDDFAARTEDGYMLRVEQMDRKAWWWQVYDPTGMQVLEDIHMMSSLEDAFIIAETVYLVHRAAKDR
jgi:hypothetical protein